MRIVLARARADSGAPSAVHAFPDPTGSESWSAVCGMQMQPGDMDIVDGFTGAPCVVCALSAAAVSAAPALSRDEVEGPPIELDVVPQPRIDPGEPIVVGAPDELLFALSWRELVVHRTTPGAPQVSYQDRVLVLATCGALGWGPLSRAPDSDEWVRCAECAQVPDDRSG